MKWQWKLGRFTGLDASLHALHEALLAPSPTHVQHCYCTPPLL